MGDYRPPSPYKGYNISISDEGYELCRTDGRYKLLNNNWNSRVWSRFGFLDDGVVLGAGGDHSRVARVQVTGILTLGQVGVGSVGAPAGAREMKVEENKDGE